MTALRTTLALLVLLSSCAPAPAVPAAVVVENPSDAFVRYWETRLRQTSDAATWRELCHAVERWPSLRPAHVERLDAAMAAWSDDLRRPPERWQPLDNPIALPVWPLIRAVEIGPADGAALATSLPHLDTVRVVTVDGADALTALANTSAFPALADVRVLASDLSSVARLVDRRGRQLVSLDLWENDLGPGLGDVLATRAWPALERLEVGANKLDSPAGTRLGRLEANRLHTLGVSFNQLGDKGFAAITAGAFPLTELDARATGIAIASVKALAQLDTSRIEVLDLSDNNLGDDGITDLATLPLTRLRALRLNRVDVTKRGMISLTNVLGGGLEVLELGRNELGDEAVALICTPGAAGLRYLQLDSVRLTNQSAAAIARCPHLRSLRSLSLHANGDLDKEGMAELAQASFGELTAIGLDNCSIRDDGLAALVEAAWWSKLTHIRLEANGITDTSAPLLAKLPTTVQNLGLGWNELGFTSAEQLSTTQLSRLKVLSLRGSALDESALRALAAAPWLSGLDDLDLRALPFDGLGPALDAVAARLPDHAILRREQ